MTGIGLRSQTRCALVALAAMVGASACYSTDNGPKPPVDTFYFPTGLAVSPGHTALYIANSDFDLQYTGGTVQVYDLALIRSQIPNLWLQPDCKQQHVNGLTLDFAGPPLRSLAGGACISVPEGPFLKATVTTGAFAADARLIVRPQPDGTPTGTLVNPGLRLLVPVRGDPSLTWLDVHDDRDGQAGFDQFTCGQAANGETCADSHRAGVDPSENTRGLTMPSEPVQVGVSDLADAIVITHQTSGTASLFSNGWPDDANATNGNTAKPALTYVMQGLPTGAFGITAVPTPKYVRVHQAAGDQTVISTFHDAFLVTYRDTPQLDVLSYYNDDQSVPSRPFLTRTGSVGFSVNESGFDSRGVALDTTDRLKCESACADTDDDCLISCAAVPLGVYVANRTPPSLLIGQTTTSTSRFGTYNDVSFYDQVILSQGASRISIGQIIDQNGDPQPRVFILCFDARELYVYDPKTNKIESIVETGRGPSAIDFDINGGDGILPDQGNYAYVAHFTDSFIGVLDLDQRHETTYMTFLLTIGSPTEPREAAQ